VPSKLPSTYLQSFWYDSILHGGPSLRFLCDLVGSDRVLLGSDYPFPVYDKVPLDNIADTNLSKEDVAKITDGNARQLFKL
ncbi:MAG: amidohydrolase family protein, partial [Dehalococcoidia bacterium]|nr:amidohydrolase family protein [Dehalococcoidia bacterium]